MIEKKEIQHFTEYARSFLGDDEGKNRDIRLKIAHSLRVLREMRRLTEAENFSARMAFCAEYTALLHDLSRFEQVQKYGTFNDFRSFDHGKRSAELAGENVWLPPALFGDAEKEDILTAVRFHNQAELPAGLPERARILCLAVRDADKLDIMRILLHHLQNPDNPSIAFGLKRAERLTPEIAAALARGEAPLHRNMKSALDFFAAKLLWPLDLNHRSSLQQWKKRHYSEKLVSFLPDTGEIRALYQLGERKLRERINSFPAPLPC